MEAAQERPLVDSRLGHTSDLDECRNSEIGAVFIIASGSSAKDFPVEEFAHVPMITMNGAISLFIGTNIKPYFYICTDMGFPKQQPELFSLAMNISQRVALWTEHVRRTGTRPTGKLFALKRAPKKTWRDYFFRSNKNLVHKHSLLSHRARSVGFSKNLSDGVFDARTVAYLALQLAHHLGFSKVILVGFDLTPAMGRFYENNDSVLSPCRLDEHYHTRILPSLKLMSKKVMGDRFSVYNLSKTSRIPESVIPRIDLQALRSLLG
ncbi:lipopolysaccharide biosynthesis protein [Pseudomonas sp. FW300-N1A1]|uniref:lipopolysaccharide biosynthesis protein n=1 Tax=Pseudomonas sp. FW300-N1A1 TaxID=2075555 RepID=UPI000CD15557|nr:lipopolysaccharide biosynthesis protein [Pseudomonas sp. FW300-N1A1]POA19040.1 lipopolysaccharide biosynthesis protein [Pseudomonas sp. FW300-N1A1]